MPKFLRQLEDDMLRFRVFLSPDKGGDGGKAEDAEDDKGKKEDESKGDAGDKPEKPKEDAEKPATSVDEILAKLSPEEREALAAQENPLKSALEKERKAKRELERAIDKQAREQKAREEAELAEAGKHKELAEKRKQELEALQAEIRAMEFRSAARDTLSEAGLSDFAEVILGPRETVDDVKAAADRIQELVNAKVEAEVLKRLETGARPSGRNGSAHIPAKKASEMSVQEKLEFIKEHGQAEWNKKVHADYAPAN